MDELFLIRESHAIRESIGILKARITRYRAVDVAALLRIGSHRQPLQTRAVAQVVNQGRDVAPPASQDSAAPAAFLLDAMAAPPRKWVSGGAPTLPCMHQRAVARLLWWEDKKTGTGFSAQCPFGVLEASINDGRSRGVRRHHHRHGGRHDHRRHRHGNRGEARRSVHRRRHHRLEDGLREDGLH